MNHGIKAGLPPLQLARPAEADSYLGMQWTKETVGALPLRGGYRMRGEAMTRIEVFSDAAFAFAVTMLVISLSAIPRNYAELVVAMKGVPAFAASFAVIMVLWVSHRRWSRRFGLDDGISTFLTLALVFIILVYVYPLKLMMNILFFAMSGGWFPSNFELSGTAEVAGLVVLYGVGFCAVAVIQLGLYVRASGQASELCLSRLERVLVKEEQIIWSVNATAGFLSALMALIFFQSLGYLAGLFYGLIPLAIPLFTMRTRKERRALQAEGSGDGMR
jgi:hypothetical protein